MSEDLPQTRITLQRYEPRFRSDWDACVRSARNGAFLFTRDFIEYHGDRFDECSLLFYKNDQPQAVLPLHREGDHAFSHRGLPFAGLIVAPQVSLDRVGEIFGLLENFLRTEGLRSLTVTPVPEHYQLAPCDEETWELLNRGAQPISRKIASVLPVNAPATLHRQRKDKARSYAERYDLVFQEHADLRECFTFYQHWLQFYHGTDPIHTLEEMLRLKSLFPDNISACAIRRDDELLAMEIQFLTPHVCRGQYSITSETGREFRAGDILNNHALQRAIDKGLTYDFGTSMNPETGEIDAHLLSYKEQFGCRARMITTWKWAIQ